MGDDLVKRVEGVEVRVNLPGTPGIVRDVPTEMLNSKVEEIIQYVLDGAFDDFDSMIAKAIKREIKGAKYTIFVAKGNEQYPINAHEKIGDIFEANPGTGLTEYQKLNFTVSKPKTGGY